MSLLSKRKKARNLLVQALYQWQISGTGLANLEAQFCTDNDMGKVDREFFHELLHGVPAKLQEIDECYAQFLDRRRDALDPVSTAVLRLGTYELMYRVDVPYRVAINEAVNQAKKFGPTDAFKYINGILDKVATQTRSVEIEAMRKNNKVASK